MFMVAWEMRYTAEGNGFKILKSKTEADALYEKMCELMVDTECFKHVYLSQLIQHQ